ncbi:MAG: ribosome silencing factor [Chlamydiota bacterium]|nr:ribosome silencing factor [Chlamydiota bacterium]
MKEDKKIAIRAAQCLDSKKATDILVLDVEDLSSIASYFIIATGLVERHIKSLANYLKEDLKKTGVRVFHVDGYEESSWIVLDYGSIIVHLFTPAMRDYYLLEKLWGDAQELDWSHE